MKRTFLKVIKNIIYFAFVVILIFYIGVNIWGISKKDYIPGIGPYKIMTVLSGSMKPTFNPGDIIVGKKTNLDNIKTGDVITFKYNSSLTTHRIINTTLKDGQLFFITKGDNNNVADVSPVDSNLVVSKYIFRIPLIGFLIAFLKGIPGIITIWAVIIFIVANDVYKGIRERVHHI
ncbi:signal peptidase I [Clostridium omnivorum]|uniref:Signal peptidase I n=1 Tax=Clostridium omnivorum TaxID=1604902 RepID=A0ABQ5N5P3_9CLOT|nr:signal peptidase I [Clostridium sp. E14]GLC30532.1 hypothetical protein bsdE14_19420 [Clostridium sp. E14]